MANFLIVLLSLVFAAPAADEPFPRIFLQPQGNGDFEICVATGKKIHSAYQGIEPSVAEEVYLKGLAVTYDTVTGPAGLLGFKIAKEIFQTEWKLKGSIITAPDRRSFEKTTGFNFFGALLFAGLLIIVIALVFKFRGWRRLYDIIVIALPSFFVGIFITAAISHFLNLTDLYSLIIMAAIAALAGMSIWLVFYKNRDGDEWVAEFTFWLCGAVIVVLSLCVESIDKNATAVGIAMIVLTFIFRSLLKPKEPAALMPPKKT